MKDDELPIDLEEVEQAKARQKNPYLRDFNNKLKELMQSEVNSKDHFINWITGLTSGAILFVFTQIKGMDYNEWILFWAGTLFFLAILSAILFKIFLKVNYGVLRLEVNLLRILWEGHEFRRNAIEEKTKKGKVCKETAEKLKRNQRESIKVLDPKHKERTIKWSTLGYNLLGIFYWGTLILFVSGFICIGVVFFSQAIQV